MTKQQSQAMAIMVLANTFAPIIIKAAAQQPPLYKMNTELDLNACHVSCFTFNMLDEGQEYLSDLVIQQVSDKVTRILVPNDLSRPELNALSIPDDLKELLNIGCDLKAKWLLLDVDGPVMDHLTVYPH